MGFQPPPLEKPANAQGASLFAPPPFNAPAAVPVPSSDPLLKKAVAQSESVKKVPSNTSPEALTAKMEKVLGGMSLKLKTSASNNSNMKKGLQEVERSKAGGPKTALKVQSTNADVKKPVEGKTSVLVTDFSEFDVTEPNDLKNTTSRNQTRNPKQPQIKPNSHSRQIDKKSGNVRQDTKSVNKKIEIPKEEFDFVSANSKFDRDRPEVRAIYSKDSFFDTAPLDAEDKLYLFLIRTDRKTVRKEEIRQNLETFGQTGVRSNRRGRGRGRGRVRGAHSNAT